MQENLIRDGFNIETKVQISKDGRTLTPTESSILLSLYNTKELITIDEMINIIYGDRIGFKKYSLNSVNVYMCAIRKFLLYVQPDIYVETCLEKNKCIGWKLIYKNL